MSLNNVNIIREKNTLYNMVYIYCRNHHNASDKKLCIECQKIYDYASLKVDNCRFSNNKPTCKNCKIHCYRKQEKEIIKAIMRSAQFFGLLYSFFAHSLWFLLNFWNLFNLLPPLYFITLPRKSQALLKKKNKKMCYA